MERWSEPCWTAPDSREHSQLADTEQETNGLLTADRKPKLDISAIRAITSRPAGSVPSEILDAIHQHEVAARRRSRTEE